MLTHDYEALIHRYLDGELEASMVLKVEEHLRSSPESRAYHERLRQLDGRLNGAFAALRRPGPELEAAVADRMRRAASTAAPPIRNLDKARQGLRTVRVAAAILIAALLAQVGLLVFGGESGDVDSAAIETLNRRITQLVRENDELRSRRPGRFEARGASFHPPTRKPPTAASATPGETPPGGEEKPALPVPDARPEKAAVLASIQGILDDFRRDGRWDLARQAQIMHDLALLDDLTEKDFRDLRHLFGQQEAYGPGQLFLAQVISRFFSHDPLAREFVYGQVDTELDRIRRGGSEAMGDRALRRAWTEGLAHAQDRRSLDYLRDLGLYDPDWVNRENAIAALAHVGNEDAVRRLGDLAVAEKDAQLKEESLRLLQDLIYSDPSLGEKATEELQRQMQEILEGEFGASGEYFDSMFWALKILRALGGTNEEFIEMWRRRNIRETGGDPRAGR